MKKISLLVGLLSLFSNASQAIVLDTMFIVSDTKGNGSYVLTNDKEANYFIETSIREIITDEKGGYSKMEYSSDNLDDWVIALSNNKLILESGRSKSLGVKAICGDNCDLSEDKTFEIAIIPKPYVPSDESYKQTMNVFIGYAPIFIIPATDAVLQYDIETDGENISIFNKSNTMVRVVVDNCQNKSSNTCRSIYTVIKGRLKKFPLPVDAIGQDLNVMVINHNEKSKEKLTVKYKG